ncbi:MAG: Gfo/Idh/MocA family oxidoreductase [Candidatus Omnitrophica bacterium]|nr:Gfo/Idh/MocA family oxidoreductase [Candidatus Omnitrophota bacterium]
MNNNKKCLVVGFGSAGARHTRNAESLGYEVALVTSQKVKKHKCYFDIAKAIAMEKPKFAVIASPTYKHVKELRQCILHNVPALVEKPLAINHSEFRNKIGTDSIKTGNYRVGYCLRYHPMILDLKRRISSLGPLYNANIVFGQYLPIWRPWRDYRKSYSASFKKGGGVLLDSSHEIDLITYLFGPVKKLVAVSKKVSSLKIDSDDICLLICQMRSGGFVQVTLDYLNRIPERRIVINAKKGSVHLDLIRGKWCSQVGSAVKNIPYSVERNKLFLQELDDFINRPKRCLLPDLKESEVTLRIIEAVRKSAQKGKWIEL